MQSIKIIRCEKSLDISKKTDSVINVWVQITWEIVANKKENVTLMDVKKHTTGYYMKKRLYRKQRIIINHLMRANQSQKLEKCRRTGENN